MKPIVILTLVLALASCNSPQSTTVETDSADVSTTSSPQNLQLSDDYKAGFDAVNDNRDAKEAQKPQEPTYTADQMTAIVFENESHDFGNIKKGDKVSHFYVYTNTGNLPAQVKVKPTCGCTAPTSPTKPTMPGKKDSIELEFNSSSFNGSIAKSASVTGNFKQPINLRFKGNVQP